MKVYPTVLLMCLANPWSLQAATYYVRTGGNDSHACSSIDDMSEYESTSFAIKDVTASTGGPNLGSLTQIGVGK